MSRPKTAPRGSEVHWIDEKEKAAALAKVPDGISFSNWIRAKVFKLEPLKHGGVRKKNETTIR